MSIKNILIVGHARTGSIALSIAEVTSSEVVHIVGAPISDMDSTVLVNGVLYEEISPTKKEQPKQFWELQNEYLKAAHESLESFAFDKPKKKTYSSKIDIVKEFGLIQLKKSNLSKSERDYVVSRFNNKYKKCK